MPDFDLDLFTIGGGSGGVRASRFAAQLGARVAIAESARFGGTCVNVGCVPKKLMSIAAHFHEDQRDAVGFGWDAATPGFSWPTLVARREQEIRRLNGLYESGLERAGVRLLRGRARIVGPHAVEIDGRRWTARHILVATGGRPSIPDIPGAHLGISSDGFFALDRQPRSVLVYGAGYIAVELASILHGLGTRTVLAFRGERVLREFDEDLSRHLAAEMEKKGVQLAPGQPLVAIERSDDGLQAIHADGTTRTVDSVLFATGRVPASQGLGLEEVGVQLGAGGAVQVDDDLCTSVPSIHAIGDVIGRVALTPVALAEGMALAERLFGQPGRRVPYDLVPTAVFSHPNVGTVGLSEAQARARGHRLRIFRSVFTPLRHTLSGNPEKTLMKLVVDADSDLVLGVHMVGPEAGELVQGFAVALTCGATKAQFDATLGIHPTLAEEFVTMRQPVAS